MENNYFIIDFDSTFTKVEAMEELCEIAMQGKTDSKNVVSQIQHITNEAMEGKLSFRESLTQRITLLHAHRQHLLPLVERLKDKVSESFVRNKEFFEAYADRIFIVSNGFKDFITPVVTAFGVKEENIFANTFLFDEAGNIIGFDDKNVLSDDNGKVKLLQQMQLKGNIYVIGDGYTDYQIREAGLADKFVAFTENVKRASVVQKADQEAPNLDEFLYEHQLPRAISYPKSRIKVLLLENIHAQAVEIFREEGYQVETISSALSEDELCEKLKDVSILGIRSKTEVTAKAIQHANRLIAIGAYCIGTNQIDLDACVQKGITVFNAPYSNTRSVVELALGEMILLMRSVPQRSMEMHKGIWNKSASSSNEIRGKKLGIIGYGNIGAQLSVLAEAMGMEVYYYDVVDKLSLGNARRCRTLKELLGLADVITIHVDGRTENQDMIGEEEFRQMKDGVVFMNLARGSVVNLQALTQAIRSKKVRGVAVDVFPEEPASNEEEFISELRNLPNVILTPHVGGSTQEAQHNIASYVPNKIIDNINTGNTFGSVNFPNIQLPLLKNAHRLIHIHRNVPGILAKINNTLAKHNVNIMGQYLKTNEHIGYVITDINKKYSEEVITELKNIENTIRFRILY